MFEFDPETIERAREVAQKQEKRLLAWFDRARIRLGWGKLTAIDRLLKRPEGHTARISRGEAKVRLDRFLFIIALLDAPWAGMARVLDPTRESRVIPESPRGGFLNQFYRKSKSKSSIDYLEALTDWIEVFEIEPEGQKINIDIDFISELGSSGGEAALGLAESHIAAILQQSKPISNETAHDFAMLVGVTAELYRRRGDWGSAIQLLDTAFELERKIRDLAARSFLYRSGAYLLSDLGELSEALAFAESALHVALATPRGEGLGQSMYVRAVMVGRLGDFDSAAPLYAASLNFLKDHREDFRANVLLSTAYAYYQIGNDSKASTTLDEAFSLEAARHDGVLRAKLLNVRANLLSRAGEPEEAEQCYVRSRALLEEHGSPSDLVISSLGHVRHLLSRHRYQEALTVTQSVGRFANQIDNPIGESAILELLRLSLQGAISEKAVAGALQALERPWELARSST